ncbi:hypothetical protein K491DRAFT_690802 [Lophiostoma macrostomum CBS 122681]|uniref:Glycoside hydrolase family 17 protein n=1 Tax=Lophiostoma macrostomum CBS 122681 TaxID=1314788 RepID=A0A6A6TCK7_9PLEO|nr:hypothetical protein K491DRAFT_690802 [Lophiostoma macrostomum CBS 122681]
MHWTTLVLPLTFLFTPVYSAPTQKSSSIASSTTVSRATWLWQSELISDTSKVSEFISFATAQGVSRVYAGVNADISNADWQSFISACTANGVEVDALFGNPNWILGSGTPTLQAQLNWIEQYQGNTTSEDQRFTGIHMDIEPWVLDDWEANKSSYVSILQTLVQQIRTFASGKGLSLATDLPFWANEIVTSDGSTLDVWMLDTIDSATFMTYRNNVDAFMDIAAAALKLAGTSEKEVWLAVEMTEQSDGDLISYYGKGGSTLTSDLAAISEQVAGIVAGIAVHDYNGWVELMSS